MAELSEAVEPLKDAAESAQKALEEASAANNGLVLELSMAKDTIVAREESLEVTRKALADKTALLDIRLREFSSLMARHEELQRKHSESEARHQKILAKKSAELKKLEEARGSDLARVNGAAKERDEAKQALAALHASFTEKVKEEVTGSTVNLVADFLDEVDRQWPFKDKDDLLALFLKMVAPETVDASPAGVPEQS